MSNIGPGREYRVILSGTGGDEVNGQPLDPCVLLAELLSKLQLIDLSRHLFSWSLLTQRPWIHLFLKTLTQLLPVSIRKGFSEQGKLEPWINYAFACKYDISARQLLAVDDTNCFTPRVRDVVQTLTAISRRMTYAAPSLVEQRYPFLDQTFVEFLSSLPLDQLLRPGQRRSLMRRALANILPQEILLRKTKAGAVRCYSIALEKHWDRVEAILLSPLSWRLGYIDKNRMRAALIEMKNGQISPHCLRLLKALSLELWLREVDERGVVSIRGCSQMN